MLDTLKNLFNIDTMSMKCFKGNNLNNIIRIVMYGKARSTLPIYALQTFVDDGFTKIYLSTLINFFEIQLINQRLMKYRIG